jgi:hypothetical protein
VDKTAVRRERLGYVRQHDPRDFPDGMRSACLPVGKAPKRNITTVLPS